jgi:hypothetical protein
VWTMQWHQYFEVHLLLHMRRQHPRMQPCALALTHCTPESCAHLCMKLRIHATSLLQVCSSFPA